ncbi:MAG: chloride channel protein [Selenomonadaceae bacterium]|nr:chloride channel protein [Selenomonadaceae bacterium]MBQ6132290.1 chloride channel protein [Selenomonadaceae bacterium]
MLSTRRLLRVRLFFEGAVVGIFTGAIVAALRFLLDEADIYRPIIFSYVDSLGRIFLAVGVMILVAAILSRAVAFDAQVAGSGVPQIKGILQGRAHMVKPSRLLPAKFFATLLGIGAGLSLGRAGISVQLGAAVGNFFSKIIYAENKHHEAVEGNFLLTAGAGAGLAAIFSAPLAGVIFCIEDLRKKFSQEILIAAVTASVSASFVVKIVFGVRPVFETITATPLNVPSVMTGLDFEMVASMSATPLKFAALFILLGIICGIVGAFFFKALIFALDTYDRLKIFGVKRFALPLLLAIPIGIKLPQILGCGNVLVDEMLITRHALSLLIILLAGKIFYTLICFGTNAPGGLFLPVLVIGALIGNIFAQVGNALHFFTADWTTLFIIFGMAAFFAAVVKAPVTGSILILELTGQFEHLVGLIVVSGAAFLISDLCGGEPIFSALLERSQNKKIPPR